MLTKYSSSVMLEHVSTCVGAAPDGDADALAGMLLAVMSLERSTAAPPSWLDEARWFSLERTFLHTTHNKLNSNILFSQRFRLKQTANTCYWYTLHSDF